MKKLILSLTTLISSVAFANLAPEKCYVSHDEHEFNPVKEGESYLTQSLFRGL